ncbi:MAG: DUF6781 family protein [Gammaproteobacteria bacterium]
MNNNSKMNTDDDQQQIHEAIKKVVQQGEDVSENVRNITMQALSSKHFDKEHIKSVLKTVWDATTDGIEHQSEQAKQTVTDVMSGLDSALEKYAHVSKLAIEETAGRLHSYTEHDLKRTLDDLKGLEEMFLDTMIEATQNTKTVFSGVLTDLMNHAKNNGTEVGRRVLQEFDDLTTKLGNTTKQGISAAGDVGASFAAEVASTASDFLADLANKLKADKKEK